MKNVQMKTSLYIIIFLSFFGLVCRSQNVDNFRVLFSEMKKTKIEINYITEKNSQISIVYPKIGINYFDSLIRSQIALDYKENYCDKEGKIFINYEVKHITSNLISLVKKVDIQFCPHFSDIHNELDLNFIIVNNNLISFDLSKAAINHLNNGLKDDSDCKYDKENLSYCLFVSNSRFYVQVWQDKICNYIVELESVKDYITFQQ